MAHQAAGLDDDDFLRLIKESENWTPEMKAKAAEVIRAKINTERRVWYCAIGRGCDGEPHEGYDYPHARGNQWPPEDNSWLTWFIRAGRGFGKTRTGGEWVRYVTKYTERIAMIGRRGTDVRETMVEGESGLIAICENAGIPYQWRPSTKEFIFKGAFKGKDATAFGFSGEEPDSLRGPQFGAAWIDEPAHIDLIEDVWDNLMFGLRIPGLPGGAKVLLTGTPLPIDFVEERSNAKSTRLTRGSTYDNLKNLDPTFRETILEAYEGTSKGMQELYGEVLRELPGALWKLDMIHYCNEAGEPFDWTECERIVVSIDPAGSTNKRSDDTGIIVVGTIGRQGYVLADATGKFSPATWAAKAVELYHLYKADAIVAENNFGGQMVKETIEHYLESTHTEARIIVTNASRAKELRAEPIVGMYEQQRMFHVRGLKKLEEEMLTWVPGKGRSPNRVDALVHGFTELMQPPQHGTFSRPSAKKLVQGNRTPGISNPLKRRKFA